MKLAQRGLVILGQSSCSPELSEVELVCEHFSSLGVSVLLSLCLSVCLSFPLMISLHHFFSWRQGGCLKGPRDVWH